MQEITPNTSQTLPVRLRKEHVPQTGDIYFYGSRGYESFYRLAEKEAKEIDGKIYVRFKTECWSFLEKKWLKEFDDSISERELTEGQYYQLLLTPFEEVVDSIEKLSRGEMPGESVNEATTEELVATSMNLPELLSTTQMLEDRMNAMSVAYRAKMKEQEKLMEKRMAPLMDLIGKTKRQLLNIHRAIDIVEIYNGENMEVVPLCEGPAAGIDVPVTVRQRILFMDEECAVLDEEGQGLDYWTRDRFYEWIKDPHHRNVILPEQKCVVVMKPRRFDRQYSRDFWEQQKMNEWNKHSFVFIRNGENVSVIESDNLCIYGAVIPRKKDFKKIEQEAKNWRNTAEEKLEDINFRCIHFAMVLQGLNDRTEIFSPHGEINFLKNVGTQIVFDDESDELIGTGCQDFRSWLKEQAQTIRRGSRIIYIRGFSEGEAYRSVPYGRSYNHPGYSGPAVPATGIYTAEDKGTSRLGFSYLPGDEVWNEEEGWHTRKRRETWLFYKDTVLNYDAVTLDVLKRFLDDRSQRRYYQGIIPFLRKFQLELEKEQKYEKLFITALSRVLDERNISYTPETLQEALKWWKNKVIHIRPISSDDQKAWRMIIGHIKNTDK